MQYTCDTAWKYITVYKYYMYMYTCMHVHATYLTCCCVGSTALNIDS